MIVLEGYEVQWFWYVTVLALSWIDLDKPEGFLGWPIILLWRFSARKDLVLETMISFVSSAFASFLPFFQFVITLITILTFLYIPLPFLLSTLSHSLPSSFTYKAVLVSTSHKACVIIVQDVKLCTVFWTICQGCFFDMPDFVKLKYLGTVLICEVAFMKKLRALWSQGMTTFIWSRIFCLIVCCQKCRDWNVQYCMCSFGYIPGICLNSADVSESPVGSIFLGWM